MNKLIANLLNFVLFQLVWLTTILGVANDLPWLGGLALVTFGIVHAFIAPSAKADFALAGVAVAIGFVVETFYIRSGLLDYKFMPSAMQVAPLWIIWLWANLALTMNNCLDWLHGRPLLAAGAGLIAGPVTYLAGERLGAAKLGMDIAPAVAGFAISWAILVPILLYLAAQARLRFAQ